jgi:hypothetical protein
MALHGEIKVNGQTIGTWEAVRQPYCGGDEPLAESMVVYACVVSQSSTLEGNPAILEKFEVRHRFGDGALALASLVLQAASALSIERARL